MIELKFNCDYQSFKLDIDQQLPSEQIIGLFGPSGSGKSKFLRQLVGLDFEALSSGVINFNQTNWLNSHSNYLLNSANRGIGYLPQSIDLFPHLTVRENVYFSQQSCNRSNQSIDSTALVNHLDIAELMSRFPEQLSGGQQQRVALARAILAAKNLLILDEPLSAQGETHKSQIMSYLKNLNSDKRLSILFASHNRVEHAYLSQHLVTFDQGRVIQSGHYENVATDISKPFAQTNDAINHVVATAVEYQEHYYLNLLEHAGHQLWAGSTPLKRSTQVLLEIKATDISLSQRSNRQSSILNCIPVEIADFHEIEKHQYLVKLAFADIYLTTFITKKSFIDMKLEKGLSLFAQFKSVSVLPFQLTSMKKLSSS